MPRWARSHERAAMFLERMIRAANRDQNFKLRWLPLYPRLKGYTLLSRMNYSEWIVIQILGYNCRRLQYIYEPLARVSEVQGSTPHWL